MQSYFHRIFLFLCLLCSFELYLSDQYTKNCSQMCIKPTSWNAKLNGKLTSEIIVSCYKNVMFSFLQDIRSVNVSDKLMIKPDALAEDVFLCLWVRGKTRWRSESTTTPTASTLRPFHPPPPIHADHPPEFTPAPNPPPPAPVLLSRCCVCVCWCVEEMDGGRAITAQVTDLVTGVRCYGVSHFLHEGFPSTIHKTAPRAPGNTSHEVTDTP